MRHLKNARSNNVLARTESIPVRRGLPYGRCLHKAEVAAVPGNVLYGRHREGPFRPRVPRLATVACCSRRT